MVWVLLQSGNESSFLFRLRMRLLGLTPPAEQEFEGWPWYPKTSGWVGPTSLSILALRKIGTLVDIRIAAETDRRIEQGRRSYLRDGAATGVGITVPARLWDMIPIPTRRPRGWRCSRCMIRSAGSSSRGDVGAAAARKMQFLRRRELVVVGVARPWFSTRKCRSAGRPKHSGIGDGTDHSSREARTQRIIQRT